MPDKSGKPIANSKLVYPTEYKGPEPIKKQIEAISLIFNLDPSSALEFSHKLPELPAGAEGWFAIPSFQKLAEKYLPANWNYLDKYCCAAQIVIDKIAETRPTMNLYSAKFDRLFLRLHFPSEQKYWRVSGVQKGDILIIGAQLGMRYRCQSVFAAQVDCHFSKDEFVLGLVAVGSIILTHPLRFTGGNHLGINCPGDDFCLGIPCFSAVGDNIYFFPCGQDEAVDFSSSASGFVPDVS
jgi:hypothetical protein